LCNISYLGVILITPS